MSQSGGVCASQKRGEFFWPPLGIKDANCKFLRSALKNGKRVHHVLGLALWRRGVERKGCPSLQYGVIDGRGNTKLGESCCELWHSKLWVDPLQQLNLMLLEFSTVPKEQERVVHRMHSGNLVEGG